MVDDISPMHHRMQKKTRSASICATGGSIETVIQNMPSGSATPEGGTPGYRRRRPATRSQSARITSGARSVRRRTQAQQQQQQTTLQETRPYCTSEPRLSETETPPQRRKLSQRRPQPHGHRKSNAFLDVPTMNMHHLRVNDDDEDVDRLRTFSASKGGIINRGDSFRRRRSRSNSLAPVSPMHPRNAMAGLNGAGGGGSSLGLGNNYNGGSSNGFAASSGQDNHQPVEFYRVEMLGSPGVGKQALVSQFRTSDCINAYDGPECDEDEQNISIILNGTESELKFLTGNPESKTFFNSVKNDVLKEAHRTQLVILERNKLKEDVRQNQKELAEYTDYAEHTLRKITKNKREIDDLTKRIKTAKSSLVDWAEAMEDGNKGYQLIDRYYQDDQQRARELNTRRQQLQADIDKRRKLVVQLYDEQNTLEKNLERTACLYREAHLERRQMVETWKQAVNQMTQRELEIQNSETECAQLIEEAEAMATGYRNANEQLNDVLENNRIVEQGIEMLNTETSEAKNEIQRLIDASLLKEREILALRHELENLSNMVHSQRLENRKLLKQRDDKNTEIENFAQTLKQVEDRLKSIEDKHTDANQRLQILDEMMEGEQEALNLLNKEQQRCNELLYRAQRQINDLKDEQKTFIVQSAALHSTLLAVNRSQRQVGQELKRQTEIYYEMSFKYLQCERRLADLRGKNADPETEARNQLLLTELEHYLAKLQRRLSSTEAQNKKLNYSMNALVIVYNNDAKDLELVKFKIKEAQVYCEGTIKRLRMNRYDNSEFVVELSLLKMRCCDLQNVIDNCEKGTYSLNQHRLAFQRIIKDRFVELKSQQDVLLLKRKHLNEELSTLRADLGERKKHISAMRARFELTSALLGVNEDGTVITATQLKVENAQERQLLADEGDSLNKKVLKAEKEVIALENTLRQFDKSNDNYRKNLKTYEDNSKDEQRAEEELKKQQEIYCNDLDKLKVLRCKAESHDNKIEDQKRSLEELIKQIETEKQKCSEDAEALDKLNKELLDQKSKIERANREIHSLMKEIKQKSISTEYLALFERDLNLQELENRNRKALNLLSDMANSDVDGPQIINYMLSKGLKLPQHLKPTRSCVSSRTTSYSSLDCYSVKGYSARSSTSELSLGKEENSSARISVVSLDFPPKKKK